MLSFTTVVKWVLVYVFLLLLSFYSLSPYSLLLFAPLSYPLLPSPFTPSPLTPFSPLPPSPLPLLSSPLSLTPPFLFSLLSSFSSTLNYSCNTSRFPQFLNLVTIVQEGIRILVHSYYLHPIAISYHVNEKINKNVFPL